MVLIKTESSEREMPSLRAGDQFVVGRSWWLGQAISWEEKGDPESDAKYTHAGIIIAPGGTTVEALWTVRYGHINDYAGCPVLIGRYQNLDRGKYIEALEKIMARLGQRYPWWRLPLALFHLARRVNDGRDVCSELAAEMWGYCTGMKEFENHLGWTPAQLACVYERWRGFEIIYKGVWEVEGFGA